MLTYILGAGASYGDYDPEKKIRTQGISIVKFIPDELLSLRDFLSSTLVEFNRKSLSELSDDHYKKSLERFINILSLYLGETSNQLSFDTYARKLIVRKNISELKKLNCILNVFLFYQECKYKIDKRYDSLFASLIKIDGDNAYLPNNLNIVTWNYDLQIQRSLCSFVHGGDILNSNLIGREFSPLEQDVSEIHNIFRLNGSILYKINYDSKEISLSDAAENVKHYPVLGYDNFELMHKLYDIYVKGMNTVSGDGPYVFYSWDIKHNDYLSKTLAEIQNRIEKSNQVVIIGYSFPVFNRAIDKKIFEKLKHDTAIYVQDINAEKIVEAFKAIKKHDKIEPIKDVSQFYIPMEYDLPL